MPTARPRLPTGAGLPPPAVRVRDVAGWQYALLAVLWLSAIALAVRIGRGIPPAEAVAGGAAYHIRTLWPIAAAFVATLTVLVRPRGAMITHGPAPAPEAYSVVSGRIRDAAGREHAVAVTVPTVAAGEAGVAREETLDLALAEAQLQHPAAEWVAAPALREADPAESRAARAALETWATRAPVPVASEPRSPVKAVALILAGCVWVSLVAPAVVAVRAGYERIVLAPLCRPHAAVTGLAYHGARLRFGSREWLDWNTPARVDCLFAGPGQPGPVEVPLERVIGRAGAGSLLAAGVLVVPIGGLLLWGAASALPAVWLCRAWRARRRVLG